MILVRFGHLVMLVAMAFLGTLGSALWVYMIATSAGLKGEAERILFYGILLGVFEVLSFLSLMVYAKRKSREFENLTDLVRYGGSISDTRLTSFGNFGVQVKSMVRELADSSDRKSIRIASLTGLVRAVVALSDRSILIIGLDGRIVAASQAILDLPIFSNLRLGVSSLLEFLPEVDLASVLEEADRSHGLVERAERVSFIPAYSINGEITHLMVEIGKKGALEAIAGMLQSRKAPSAKKMDSDLPSRSGVGKRLRAFLKGGKTDSRPAE